MSPVNKGTSFTSGMSPRHASHYHLSWQLSELPQILLCPAVLEGYQLHRQRPSLTLCNDISQQSLLLRPVSYTSSSQSPQWFIYLSAYILFFSIPYPHAWHHTESWWWLRGRSISLAYLGQEYQSIPPALHSCNLQFDQRNWEALFSSYLGPFILPRSSATQGTWAWPPATE